MKNQIFQVSLAMLTIASSVTGCASTYQKKMDELDKEARQVRVQMNGMDVERNSPDKIAKRTETVEHLANYELHSRFKEGTVYYPTNANLNLVTGQPAKLISVKLKSHPECRIKGMINSQIPSQHECDKLEAVLTFEQGKESKDFSYRLTFRRKSDAEFELISQRFDEGNNDPFAEEDIFKKYRNNVKIMKAIAENRAFVGMPEDALYLAIGTPSHVNETEVRNGAVKQLVYGGGRFIYISGGRVTGVQNFNN